MSRRRRHSLVNKREPRGETRRSRFFLDEEDEGEGGGRSPALAFSQIETIDPRINGIMRANWNRARNGSAMNPRERRKRVTLLVDKRFSRRFICSFAAS